MGLNANSNINFEQNLLNIQKAEQEGKSIGFRKSTNGNIEVFSYSKWNYLTKIILTIFSNQEILKERFEKNTEDILKKNEKSLYDVKNKKLIISLLEESQINFSTASINRLKKAIKPIFSESIEEGIQSIDEDDEIGGIRTSELHDIRVIKELYEKNKSLIERRAYISYPLSFSSLNLFKIRLNTLFLLNLNFDHKDSHKIKLIEELKGRLNQSKIISSENDSFRNLEYELNSKFLFALLNNRLAFAKIAQKNPDYLNELIENVVSTLETLTSVQHQADTFSKENPSLLITSDHVKLLSSLIESPHINKSDLERITIVKSRIDSQMKNASSYIKNKYNNLFKELKQIDRQKVITGKLSALENDIKNAFLDIEQRFGRTYSLSTLVKSYKVSVDVRTGIKLLYEFEKKLFPPEGIINFSYAQPIKGYFESKHKTIYSNLSDPLLSSKKVEESLKIIKEMVRRFSEENLDTAVTLSDIRPWIEANLYLDLKATINDERAIIELGGKEQINTINRRIVNYFKLIHQESSYRDLVISVRRDFLFALMNDPETLNDRRRDRTIDMLCEDVLKNIYTKATHDPSILGHSRDLVTLDDIRALRILKEKFSDNPTMSKMIHTSLVSINHKLENVKFQIKKHKDVLRRVNQLSKVDIANLPELIKKYENADLKTLAQDSNIQLILDARQVILDIELQAGRFFDLSILSATSNFINSETSEALKKARELDALRGQAIDLAQLSRLNASHNLSKHHPRVAIEGGGPTGLLSALTQYESGAKVSLFERRTGIYERSQILRLDPKWMVYLKYYLGEKFYTTFQDENHKGIIREEGFGEIATMDLEAILNLRLIELKSIIDPHSNDLEVFTAHELVEVKEPKTANEKFKIRAKYTGSELGRISSKQEKSDEVREIDYFVCAGGKNSVLRDKFLPSFVPVTEAKHYGVVSWQTSFEKGDKVAKSFNFEIQNKDNKDKFDVFQNFNGVININQDFINRFIVKITTKDGVKFIKDIGQEFDEEIQQELIQTLNNFFHDIKVDKIIDDRNFLQTRTFENRGLIYIGMELPDNLKKLLSDLRNQLESSLQDKTEKENIKKIVDGVMNEVNYAWFQTVADSYGYGEVLTQQNMDKKFTARFDVEQNRIEEAYSNMQAPNGQTLTVMALGDAFVSPHFMSSSGLTGARESVIHLQEYMKQVNQNPDKQEELLEKFNERMHRTADFAISRGRAFLTPLSETEIKKNRAKKLEKELEKLSNESGLAEYGIENTIIDFQKAEHPTNGSIIYYNLLSRDGRSFVFYLDKDTCKLVQISSENQAYNTVPEILSAFNIGSL